MWSNPEQEPDQSHLALRLFEELTRNFTTIFVVL